MFAFNHTCTINPKIPWMQAASPPLDFSIRLETEDFAVIEKPPGLLVHPTKPNSEPTLLEGLKALFCYEETIGGIVTPIHRLDRETSGLLLVAKNHHAASSLSQAMQNGLIQKNYLALCFGWPTEHRWEVEGPILKASSVGQSKVWLRRTLHPNGKPAHTFFTTIACFQIEMEKFSLILATPTTGRTHQIRIHLAKSNLPIVGDKVYARGEEWFLHFLEKGLTNDLLNSLKLPRHALHSFRLTFEHKGIHYDVISELPTDWLPLVDLNSLPSYLLPKPLTSHFCPSPNAKN
ncbi:MAG: RluA family pseudouridine synthase [Chthoniobacterales bacterium]|nr:RluA family pseudouridine synthase [Chthoniobacterales bacterium]